MIICGVKLSPSLTSNQHPITISNSRIIKLKYQQEADNVYIISPDTIRASFGPTVCMFPISDISK